MMAFIGSPMEPDMTTRDSTPKHEVVHEPSGFVSITGISKSEAKEFARGLNKGQKSKRYIVRRVRKAEA
jgi:hypothetical protein